MTTYLGRSPAEIKPIVFVFTQKPDEHAGIESAERQLPHAVAVERLQIGGRVRADVVVLDRVETPACGVGDERADLEPKVAVVGVGTHDGGSEGSGGSDGDSPWREGEW